MRCVMELINIIVICGCDGVSLLMSPISHISSHHMGESVCGCAGDGMCDVMMWMRMMMRCDV